MFDSPLEPSSLHPVPLLFPAILRPLDSRHLSFDVCTTASLLHPNNMYSTETTCTLLNSTVLSCNVVHSTVL